MHNKFVKIQSEMLNELLKSVRLKHPATPKEVTTLSDLYLKKHSELFNIWQSEGLLSAYLNYFFTLNWLRLKFVIQQGLNDQFFDGLTDVVEFGSGPGTFHLAAVEASLPIANFNFIEIAEPAKTCHHEFAEQLQLMRTPLKWSHQAPTNIAPHALAVFSYSLNEISDLPAWVDKCEALLIAEPATQTQARALQKLRDQLIERGWHVWAPCTHQQKCPLLQHSERDWCHARLHISPPKEFVELEKHLPMKNETVTVSYLLARKDRPNPRANHKARLIGDTLFERGKVRQALCRGSQREFASWLTRNGEPELLENGARVLLPENVETRGNEIRLPLTLIKD